VDTLFLSNAQGQRTHSARANNVQHIEDLKEATGASVEEEGHAESLKQLQENMTLFKVNKIVEIKNKHPLFFPTLLFFLLLFLQPMPQKQVDKSKQLQ
jgi:hypothetical protein